MGGVKVGANATGVYVGGTQISGKSFDWSKLFNNLSYVWSNQSFNNILNCVITNLSSRSIFLQRDGVQTEIRAGVIDYFNIGKTNASSNIDCQIFNGTDSSKNVLLYVSEKGSVIPTTYIHTYKNIASPDALIIDMSNTYESFTCVCFVFDLE